MAAPFTIKHRLTISAPSETVWKVITDMPRYGEWNQFVVACESTLAENAPIKMRVRVLPFFAMPQQETIRAHIPGKKLSYGIQLPFYALYSDREHIVTPLSKGTTVYESNFTLNGWLAPLVQSLLGKQLQRGFDDMAKGIASRATSLA